MCTSDERWYQKLDDAHNKAEKILREATYKVGVRACELTSLVCAFVASRAQCVRNCKSRVIFKCMCRCTKICPGMIRDKVLSRFLLYFSLDCVEIFIQSVHKLISYNIVNLEFAKFTRCSYFDEYLSNHNNEMHFIFRF